MIVLIGGWSVTGGNCQRPDAVLYVSPAVIALTGGHFILFSISSQTKPGTELVLKFSTLVLFMVCTVTVLQILDVRQKLKWE